MDFAERDICKPVLLRFSLAGNLKKHLCPFRGPNEGSVAMDSDRQLREKKEGGGGREGKLVNMIGVH